MTVPTPYVPLTSDGGPNFGVITTAGNAGVLDGKTTIWNMPSSLKTSATIPIWFDIKYSTTHDTNIPTPHGYGKTAEPTGTPVTHTSSSQVLADPEKIYKQWSAMSANSPADFVALQKALASGPWGTVHINGVFDNATQMALGTAIENYKQLTSDAGAGVGMSFTQYLLGFGQRAQALGGGGTSSGLGTSGSAGPKPLDPARIRGAAQQAAQQALGQGLTAKQLDDFVNQFTAQQTSSGTDAYTSNIGLPDKAMAFVQQENPGAYKQNQQQAFIDTLVNMFAPSGSQRPNMTPTPAYNPGS